MYAYQTRFRFCKIFTVLSSLSTNQAAATPPFQKSVAKRSVAIGSTSDNRYGRHEGEKQKTRESEIKKFFRSVLDLAPVSASSHSSPVIVLEHPSIHHINSIVSHTPFVAMHRWYLCVSQKPIPSHPLQGALDSSRGRHLGPFHSMQALTKLCSSERVQRVPSVSTSDWATAKQNNKTFDG